MSTLIQAELRKLYIDEEIGSCCYKFTSKLMKADSIRFAIGFWYSHFRDKASKWEFFTVDFSYF